MSHRAAIAFKVSREAEPPAPAPSSSFGCCLAQKKLTLCKSIHIPEMAQFLASVHFRAGTSHEHIVQFDEADNDELWHVYERRFSVLLLRMRRYRRLPTQHSTNRAPTERPAAPQQPPKAVLHSLQLSSQSDPWYMRQHKQWC
jgi:hypothetical protein